MIEVWPDGSSEGEKLEKLKRVLLSYQDLSAEIRTVVGKGEGGTDQRSIAEKKADASKRKLLDSFLDAFPDKQELPEFIDCEKEVLGRKDKKYLFPRTKEIYTISGSDDVLKSEVDKDDSFLPESPRFRGAEIVARLIKQNQNARPFTGLYIQGAEPRFSEEEAVNSDRPEYELMLGEKLQNNEIGIIIKKLDGSIKSPGGRKLFEEFQKSLAGVDDEQIREQALAEEKYAVILKEKLREWVLALEKLLGTTLADRIPLLDEGDFDTELGMLDLRKSMERVFKKRGRETTPRKKAEFSQIYFYPHAPKIEFVPVKKVGIIKKWKESGGQIRSATPREFIAKRMEIKNKLWHIIPDEIRSNLLYP